MLLGYRPHPHDPNAECFRRSTGDSSLTALFRCGVVRAESWRSRRGSRRRRGNGGAPGGCGGALPRRIDATALGWRCHSQISRRCWVGGREGKRVRAAGDSAVFTLVAFVRSFVTALPKNLHFLPRRSVLACGNCYHGWLHRLRLCRPDLVSQVVVLIAGVAILRPLLLLCLVGVRDKSQELQEPVGGLTLLPNHYIGPFGRRGLQAQGVDNESDHAVHEPDLVLLSCKV